MGTALTWQNGRQLATYGSGSKLVTYGYDGDGLRISKSGARNTEYIIVGGTYVGERTTINGTEYLIAYLYGDSGIIGINVNGTNYYFVKNLQGDITGIIDTNGNVVARYTYDAYGAPIDITDGDGNAVSINNHTHIANLNPFRYRGYTYDQETGLYYLTTRYYDPYVGRFLNADAYVTTGQGFDGNNMFVYCGNNPVSRGDSSGTDWKDYILGPGVKFILLLMERSKNKKEDGSNESEKKPYNSKYLDQITPEVQKALDNTHIDIEIRANNYEYNINDGKEYVTATARLDIQTNDINLKGKELRIYAHALAAKIEEEIATYDTGDKDVILMTPSHIIWEYNMHYPLKGIVENCNVIDFNVEESMFTLAGRFIR